MHPFFRIFRYELQRLLLNQLFFGILLIALGYGWLTLTGTMILGIAHTAPFSPWSFGYYLSQILPLLCAGELFFLTFYASKEELRVKPMAQAALMNPLPYLSLRCGAVLTATLLLSLCAAALAAGFYVSLFGWRNYGDLVLPALFTLLPDLLLCFGAGLAFGQNHPKRLYLLLAAVLLLSLPSPVSLSLSGFYSQYPLTLDVPDPAFQIPARLLLQKGIYIALGILGVLSAVRTQKRAGLEMGRSFIG